MLNTRVLQKVLRIAADITHASFISSRSIAVLLKVENRRIQGKPTDFHKIIHAEFKKLYCKEPETPHHEDDGTDKNEHKDDKHI